MPKFERESIFDEHKFSTNYGKEIENNNDKETMPDENDDDY